MVVTGYPLEYHSNLISASFETEDFEFLQGTYIWKFEESSDAMDGLNKLIKSGDIEYFLSTNRKISRRKIYP